MRHNLNNYLQDSVLKSVDVKHFNAINVSAVTLGQRSVLSVNFPELFDLYRSAKPARREDLRAYRMKK